MCHQAFLRTATGLLCVGIDEQEGTGTIEHLKSLVEDTFGIPAFEQRIVRGDVAHGGSPFSTNDSDKMCTWADGEDCAFPPTFSVLLRVVGGKGGFGSMLRAQGGKMASRKTTNHDSCRDLSGRRLKTVNEAKKLAEFLENEPERKRKQGEERQKKIEEGLKERETKKIRFDDNDYLNDHEKALQDVKAAVGKVTKKVIANDKLKKSPLPPGESDDSSEAKASSSSSSSSSSKENKLAMWDEPSSSEEDDD